MPASTLTLPKALAVLREFLRIHAPGLIPVELIVIAASGQKIRWPFVECLNRDQLAGGDTVLDRGETGPEPVAEQFIPTAYQDAILTALAGRALRTDALASKVGDRSRLFRHPGGLKELQFQGLVKHHSRLGYYRPDDPPAALAEPPDSSAAGGGGGTAQED